MIFLIFSILNYLLLIGPDDFVKDKKFFISPVKIPLALSANFGELRSDHFHSGIDIKTQGVTGQEVVAAADGYIYRIGVSPTGFGRALYMKHSSGYSTLYGHLESFSPEVEKYVIEQQYIKKSFAISLFPAAGRFSFKQGDVIARSGNSGSSGGPHLHYEIRQSETETPLNPLLFEFGAGDDIKPVIERMAIYPIGRKSSVNGKGVPLKLSVQGGSGNYYISESITVYGETGFGIKASDLLNDSFNKCAVYSIDLEIDSVNIFSYKIDKFDFAETRYVNAHIDYETYMRDRTYYERAFILPGDRLSVYKGAVKRGVFNFRDSLFHSVKITVSDLHGNKSTLSLKVKSLPEAIINTKVIETGAITMPLDRSNRFRAEGMSLTIPTGALYDTLFFTYKNNQGTPEMLSDVHHLHNQSVPLHKPFALSIKPLVIPQGKESKLTIIRMNSDFQKTAISSTYANGYVNGETNSFGMYYVGIDTVPPIINGNGMASDSDLSGRKEFRIRISDNLTGINTYEPIIDGKWALMEYDQKNNVLIYRFDPTRVMKNSDHTFSLKVVDNKENVAEFNCKFRW